MSSERAGQLLDTALSARSINAQGRDSHFIFTLHLYQHTVTSTSPSLLGGRSRLHLIDFGCCERTKTLGGSITQAGLGNVILGVLNGQRHLPFKESRVTQLLKEVLGSVSCQAATPPPPSLLPTLPPPHLPPLTSSLPLPPHPSSSSCPLGGPAGPHLPRAKPLLRDPAHHPAGLQDPQDAPQENAGGRRQWRGQWQREQ